MSRAWPRVTLALASLSILGALLFGGRVLEIVFVVLVLFFPVGLIALGTRNSVHPRRRALLLVSLLLALESSGLGMLALSGVGKASEGLPASAILMFTGLGLLPLILVSVGHAWTHDAGCGRSAPAETPADRR